MRPFIEHAVRTGYVKTALTFPFSLFLYNLYDSQDQIVIVVNKDNDVLKVRHWHIAHMKSNDILPQYRDYAIKENELFNSVYTCLPDYYPIQYIYEEYNYEYEPEGVISEDWCSSQRALYKEVFNNHFFSKKHQENRENVLWKTFIKNILNESFNDISYMNGEKQRSLVKKLSPAIWSNWLLWVKTFLNFNTKIAPELAFDSCYAHVYRNKPVKKKINGWNSQPIIDFIV